MQRETIGTMTYHSDELEEREIEAREECARRGLDPDDDAADGASVWMVVDQELNWRPLKAAGDNWDESDVPF